ncbi:spore germination protein [Paenibacillus turicensis]|uniref:Spore germination protein n=1 Tax=Paenibacillus turicensis TaxID=160487 RepID=A0ABS4FSU0_9BACL|nr:Ger(x)C family spore germination protein [Paenibacillus turicensis]MBP1905647.1 spore germination protein [Paenibacillus turicensis]
MYKYIPKYKLLIILATIVFLLPGCWSSKEIEDLSIYAGIAIDAARPTELEQKFVEKGSKSYQKKDEITLTVQVVPVKAFGSKTKTDSGNARQFNNVTISGNSVLELMRQYSIWRDRPVIGHHLKVIVISNDALKKYKVGELTDFILRDNDIRPSALLFLSEGDAKETLLTNNPGEVPAFKLQDMTRNTFRTNKILKGFTLTQLDEHANSKQSYILQNIVSANDHIEFSGAGIIKGDTGYWIGNLTQDEVATINLINGNTKGGLIKAYNKRGKQIVYEIKNFKSKMRCTVKGNDISYHVELKSDGRLIENWDDKENFSEIQNQEKAEKIFEEHLLKMIQSVMKKTQKVYQADVIGFQKCLSIRNPKMWKKVKDRWDEVYANIPVDFDVKLTITDFGASTE